MVQFTLGCILVALTLFFGGKEFLSNQDMIEMVKQSAEKEETKVLRAQAAKKRYLNATSITLKKSANMKTNLVSQLGIDESYKFEIKEPEVAKRNNIIQVYDFSISGFNKFGDIFVLISDIENVSGLEIENICLNCSPSIIKSEDENNGEISFEIEGKAYVFNE